MIKKATLGKTFIIVEFQSPEGTLFITIGQTPYYDWCVEKEYHYKESVVRGEMDEHHYTDYTQPLDEGDFYDSQDWDLYLEDYVNAALKL